MTTPAGRPIVVGRLVADAHCGYTARWIACFNAWARAHATPTAAELAAA